MQEGSLLEKRGTLRAMAIQQSFPPGSKTRRTPAPGWLSVTCFLDRRNPKMGGGQPGRAQGWSPSPLCTEGRLRLREGLRLPSTPLCPHSQASSVWSLLDVPLSSMTETSGDARLEARKKPWGISSPVSCLWTAGFIHGVGGGLALRSLLQLPGA